MKIFYSPLSLWHADNYADTQERLGWITETLDDYFFPSSLQKSLLVKKGEKFARKYHSADYIDFFKKLSSDLEEEESGEIDPGEFKDYSGENLIINQHSFNAACSALTCCLKAKDEILKELKKESFPSSSYSPPSSLVLVRPAGHHATPECGEGFCFFNNLAITALEASNSLEEKKILVLDVDLHHGNGTEEFLRGYQRIQFISVFQEDTYPLYAAPGNDEEDNILRICVEKEFSDRDWETTLEMIKEPVYLSDLILVSLGTDFLKDDYDEYANRFGCLTPDSYEALAQLISSHQKPVIYILEGGYNPLGLRAVVERLISVHQEQRVNFRKSFIP